MSTQTPSRPDPARRTSTLQKRQSMLPKPSSIVLDPSVLIAQHAQLTGTHPITIGPNAILHPHCKVSSAFAPVVLGEGVLIYERARAGVGFGDTGGGSGSGDESRRSSVASSGGARDSLRVDGTVLGKNVVVESAAVVEAAEVGEGSVIEAQAVLGRGCVVGKFCTIGASCVLPPNTSIPDYTVVYGGGERRIDKTLQSRPEILQARVLMHTRQIDMFKKLVPNNVAKWST
ncbi:trimeric LpxA-like protein [Lophiostoma macrostomum CBS 122681]|uniref:Dynactin subunit 6 n=1 Tax=Lophiostoma macrostomum CBS 122681 TaxID=1314788 RepID=A0A6A6TCW4_9PLEO|nr:trimeric LpxA-like protein [Lophiostoma macrostomum CBS 122681]